MVFLPVALSFFEKDTQFQTNQRALNYRSTKAPEKQLVSLNKIDIPTINSIQSNLFKTFPPLHVFPI